MTTTAPTLPYTPREDAPPSMRFLMSLLQGGFLPFDERSDVSLEIWNLRRERQRRPDRARILPIRLREQ